MDEKLMPLKDLEFVIDDEMKETIFQMLTIQQMLDKEDISKRERKMLEKHKFDLLEDFKYKLHTLNPTQIAIVKTYLIYYQF